MDKEKALAAYEHIIDIEKASCKSGFHYLVKDITWQVRPGEHWVVFGMNGSGKTTLLSIIAGYKHFTSGKVKLFGEEYTNKNILDIRQRIGWVSSSFFDQYYSKESALDIVLSGLGGNLGLNPDITLEAVVQAKDLLIEFGLEDKIDAGFDMLSKGQRQNVLIARALISDPDILILDEPCAGLDIYSRSYLFSTIEALRTPKALTIIYVTHYVEEITPLFDQAILLKNGRIFTKGKTAELFTPLMMEELLGYPVEIYQEEDKTYRLKIKTRTRIIKNQISVARKKEQV